MRTATPGNVWIEKRTLPSGRTTYRIRWTDPATGQKASRAAGRTLAQAKIELAEKSQELRAIRRGEALPKRLSDLIAALPAWMVSKSAASRRNARLALVALSAACGNLRIGHVSRERIMALRAWLLDKELAKPTVNRYLRTIKGVLSLAADANWLPANPLLRWRKMQVVEPERKIRVVEPAEFRQLLEHAADDGLRLAMMLAYWQGLRRGEICRLRWMDVDIRASTLTVANVGDEGLTKSRKMRIVPLRGCVRKAIEAAPRGSGGQPVVRQDDGSPFHPDRLTHLFEKVVDVAVAKNRMPRCTLHDLRRSWSSHLQEAGVDAETVRRLGGWSCISVMRSHYTGDQSRHDRQVMRMLDRRAGKVS